MSYKSREPPLLKNLLTLTYHLALPVTNPFSYSVSISTIKQMPPHTVVDPSYSWILTLII